MDVRMDGRVAVITGAAPVWASQWPRNSRLRADPWRCWRARRTSWQGPRPKCKGRRQDQRQVKAIPAMCPRRSRSPKPGRRSGRLRQGRHRGQQRRHQPCQGVRHRDRRGLAGRPRPETVRGHSSLPARLARHARAQVGPNRQCAEHRRQGAGRQLDADQRQPRGRSRAHKGDPQENASHSVLVNAMLVGLIESDQWRAATRRLNAGKTTRSSPPPCQGTHPARPHGQSRGVRPHGLLPVLRCGLVHYRRGDQCRRRRKPGGVKSP